MKELAEIFLCMFAIYGIYRSIISLGAYLSGKIKVVLAIRAEDTYDRGRFEKRMSDACARALNSDACECVAVILCEDAESAASYSESGYEIYIKKK